MVVRKQKVLDKYYLLKDNTLMDLLAELKLQNTSINECSKKTGIPYGSLHPLLHKSKPLERCEYNTLKKLSDFFHCSIDDLFDEPKNFSVFWKDEKTADVTVTENAARVKRYTKNPAKQLFCKSQISLFELDEIFKWRCWDQNRENIEKYLYKLGLTQFNPYKICKKTHGAMYQDNIWFKFEGEKLSWSDVKCR